jgi:hypothetical protein
VSKIARIVTLCWTAVSGCVSVQDHLDAGRFEDACFATRSDMALRAATAAAISARSEATVLVRALDDAGIRARFGDNFLDDRTILLEVSTDFPQSATPGYVPQRHVIDITVQGLRADRIYLGSMPWFHEELANLLDIDVEHAKGDGRALFDYFLGRPPKDTWEPYFVCHDRVDCKARVSFAGQLETSMWKGQTDCQYGRLQPCRRYVLLHAFGPDEAGPPVLRLGVQHSFNECWTEYLVDVPLGTGATLVERINQPFAAGPLTLRELGGPAPVRGSRFDRCTEDVFRCRPPARPPRSA